MPAVHICSFIDATGEGLDRNGKLWRWDFSEWFGPLFLKKNGVPLERQPISEKHPAWSAFEPWHEKYKQEHPRERTT